MREIQRLAHGETTGHTAQEVLGLRDVQTAQVLDGHLLVLESITELVLVLSLLDGGLDAGL
jgi:hypothetical protein